METKLFSHLQFEKVCFETPSVRVQRRLRAVDGGTEIDKLKRNDNIRDSSSEFCCHFLIDSSIICLTVRRVEDVIEESLDSLSPSLAHRMRRDGLCLTQSVRDKVSLFCISSRAKMEVVKG